MSNPESHSSSNEASEHLADSPESSSPFDILTTMPPFDPGAASKAAGKIENGDNGDGKQSEAAGSPVPTLTGEFSKLYVFDGGEGGPTVRLESEYLDHAQDFVDKHLRLRFDEHLSVDLLSLAEDLAMLDVDGAVLADRESEVRDQMLDRYAALQHRLQSKSTASEDKDLIQEYLDVMQGKALVELHQAYSESDKAEQLKKAEEEEQRKAEAQAEEEKLERRRFAERLAQTKEDLMRARNLFLEGSEELDRVLRQIEDLRESRTGDMDEIRHGLQTLMRAQYDLNLYMRRFGKLNEEYDTDLVRGRDKIDESDYATERRLCSENYDMVDDAKRKLRRADDESNQLHSQLRLLTLDADMASYWRGGSQGSSNSDSYFGSGGYSGSSGSDDSGPYPSYL